MEPPRKESKVRIWRTTERREVRHLAAGVSKIERVLEAYPTGKFLAEGGYKRVFRVRNATYEVHGLPPRKKATAKFPPRSD